MNTGLSVGMTAFRACVIVARSLISVEKQFPECSTLIWWNRCRLPSHRADENIHLACRWPSRVADSMGKVFLNNPLQHVTPTSDHSRRKPNCVEHSRGFRVVRNSWDCSQYLDLFLRIRTTANTARFKFVTVCTDGLISRFLSRTCTKSLALKTLVSAAD